MKNLKIHYLQHVHFEGLGCINEWALHRGHKVNATRFYENDKLPEIKSFDWLIIMGGPMGVHDEGQHPWLKEEKEFIKKAIEADKIVIGICLGSQLIAACLGAAVYPNTEKEIGWFPIFKTKEVESTAFDAIPSVQTVFHWHGDTFDLPAGAVRLAETAACKNQAFLYKNNVLGLQFHFEVTQDSLQQLAANCRHELVSGDYIQTEDFILKNFNRYADNKKLLEEILDRLVGNF